MIIGQEIFLKFQVLIIGFGVLIPIVNVISYPDELAIRIISSILGSLITGITGLVQLIKAQESWLLFRSTAETLKREYQLFMQKSGDYSDSNLTEDKKNKMFIERTESIISAEGSKYFSFRQRMQTEKNI
ncbi:MAG TPA: DUF4231 domain-containing protein [Nitrososphaeraceae archaeon]|nr:DUF4231 domain-containing protein [Nitrososphaeraceae archaeon]